MNVRAIAVLFFLSLPLAGPAYPDTADSTPALPARCGTIEALSLSKARGKILARYTLSDSVLSSAGHFRVHYNTTGTDAPSTTDGDLNGIPDYVDSTLIYLEYAWSLEVTTLGYNPPRGDTGLGGGREIDVYLKDLGSQGIYGVTYSTNDSSGTASAYMVVDNDFQNSIYTVTKGYDALKVTTAHEFFHVIQFGYSTSESLGWWMEQTATWMEDQAWSNVNDYIAYLYYFFKDGKKYPLDKANGSFEYGAVLWPTYLASTFGNAIIRSSWEKARLNPYSPYSNMSSFFTPLIAAYSDSATFASALNEFGCWNFFTVSRAPSGQFYTDGSEFKYSMSMDDTLETDPSSVSLSTIYLTSNYVEILFAGSWSGATDAIAVKTTPSTTGRTHKSSLIFYTGTSDFRIVPLADSSVVPLEKEWSRALVVTTCYNAQSVSGYCTVTAAHTTIDTVESNAPSTFRLYGTFPNPFNPATTIRFDLPASGLVRVQAYDILGRKAADIFTGQLAAGEKNILWKPEKLASGVYFIRVMTPSGSQTTKTLLVK